MCTVLTNHKEAAGLDPQLVSLKFSEVPWEVEEDSARVAAHLAGVGGGGQARAWGAETEPLQTGLTKLGGA